MNEQKKITSFEIIIMSIPYLLIIATFILAILQIPSCIRESTATIEETLPVVATVTDKTHYARRCIMFKSGKSSTPMWYPEENFVTISYKDKVNDTVVEDSFDDKELYQLLKEGDLIDVNLVSIYRKKSHKLLEQNLVLLESRE